VTALQFDPGYGPLLDTTVRIASWNLWGWYEPWAVRQPAIIETLHAIDADILGLQEVWEDDTRNQAAEIAAALGYEHYVFAHNLEVDGRRAGNAVVSRWPISRHEVAVLPRDGAGARDDEGEERLCVFANVEGPRGPIQIYCAHLSWRSDHSGVRQAQVRAICEFVRAQRPRPFPAVLVGDLNSVPASEEIRMLTGRVAAPVPGVLFRDAWEEAGDGGAGYTISHANPYCYATLGPQMRIDYVMAGQPKLGGAGHVRTIRIIGDQPVAGTHPSDHYGLVAELRY
jgi:endonuclease/exonuclease/phosphatase family metal-dependent hydrolase